MRGANDDDVVTRSLGGDGSSCVQAAAHRWNDTTLLAGCDNTQNASTTVACWGLSQLILQGRGERRPSEVHQPCFFVSLHKQKIRRARACEAQKQSRRGSAVHFRDLCENYPFSAFLLTLHSPHQATSAPSSTGFNCCFPPLCHLKTIHPFTPSLAGCSVIRTKDRALVFSL